MFAKISICVLLAVVLFESASSFVVPTNQQVAHPFLARQLQLQEGENAPASGNSFLNLIKNIFTTILTTIKAIAQLIINLVGCTILQPYLSLINVLSSILNYISEVVGQYSPASAGTIDPIIQRITEGLSSFSKTLQSLLVRVSNMGCGV